MVRMFDENFYILYNGLISCVPIQGGFTQPTKTASFIKAQLKWDGFVYRGFSQPGPPSLLLPGNRAEVGHYQKVLIPLGFFNMSTVSCSVELNCDTQALNISLFADATTSLKNIRSLKGDESWGSTDGGVVSRGGKDGCMNHCDASSLQKQPPKDAAPEFRHSYWIPQCIVKISLQPKC